MNGCVLVGVDGSPDGRQALMVAVDEAVSRERPLRIVYVDERPPGTPGDSPAVAEQAAAYVRETAPGVRVETWQGGGEPGVILAGMSAEAVLLVAGSRGLGGFAGLLAGSVSRYVAVHAECPVLVVRPGRPGRPAPESPGTVVVGLDPERPVDEAVGFAVEEAALHQVGARIVVAAPHPAGTERRAAEEAARRWGAAHPRVRIWTDVVELPPAQALIAASEEAGLLVVGTRGRHRHLARVDHAVLHHASCPVALVPARP